MAEKGELKHDIGQEKAELLEFFANKQEEIESSSSFWDLLEVISESIETLEELEKEIRQTMLITFRG